MHGAYQAPSMTNWKQFVQSAPHVRQQRLRELEHIWRQQIAGCPRRCLPDPKHGPFSAQAGSPLHQSSNMKSSHPSLRASNRNTNAISAHLASNNLASGASTRKVTFNLSNTRPPGGSALARSRTALYRSASDGTLDTDFQPDYQKLRIQRHLPEQPLDKAPLSPTLPMAKLRLQRNLNTERLAANNLNVLTYDTYANNSNAWLNTNGVYNASTSHAHSVPSSPIKRSLNVAGSGRMLPNNLNGNRLFGSSTIDHQMARLRQRLPVCKSSPASAVMGNSSSARAQTPVGRQLAKYGNSPATQMRRELRYFAQERKRELESGLDERAPYLGPYPPAWHQPLSSSDSELNALLDLWSRPPDPVRDRQPPAGASNLQRVPQYVLGASGTSLHELRPTPTRRASFGCGGLYPSLSRHSTGASLYGTNTMLAYNSLNNLGHGGPYEYDCGPVGCGRPVRPVVRYASCGRLDDYDLCTGTGPSYPFPVHEPHEYSHHDLLSADLNNNMLMSTSSAYAQNGRHWSNNNSKSCVTLLPTRPYRL